MTVKQTFHWVKLGFTRCYLVKCLGGYLLIDTSDAGYFCSFQKRTAKLGIQLTEIKYLLLTHHHDDHAGFAAELVEKSGCRVVVHRDAVSPLQQGKAEYAGAKVLNRRVYATMMFYSWYYILFHGKTFPPLTFSDRDIVLEGDNESFLKDIGIDGVILHTPGHSRDSISVLLSDGTAFVGDVAMNLLWWTGMHHRPIGFDDINTVYESWQKLREHGARMIHPAHGKPFSAQELVPSRVTSPLEW
jgi:glyoxylase-like metal-dependent hydrolase (beta-lactamase superfamily II)